MLLSVAYIGPKSKTERHMKTEIGTEIAHVIRDSDTTFNIKSQGHQAALFSAALTRKVAAVSVGTYSAWKVLLRCVSSAAREVLWRPQGRRGAEAYCVATRTACFPTENFAPLSRP